MENLRSGHGVSDDVESRCLSDSCDGSLFSEHGSSLDVHVLP